VKLKDRQDPCKPTDRRFAAELLSLMSFFNAQGIPIWLFRGNSRDVESCDDDEAESAFEEDFDTLQAYSLVTLTENSNAWEMHALVHLCTPVWLSTFGNLKRWNSKFVALIVREFLVQILRTGQYASSCFRISNRV
jgi:hypothetical protein